MSEVTTNSSVVNSEATSAAQVQVDEAVKLTEEQQAEATAEAKKELGLVVKALKAGNRETVVSQCLAGMHGLKFINLCRKAGRARSFATGELERELSWWLGKSADANLKAIRKRYQLNHTTFLSFEGYLNSACTLLASGLRRRSMRWMALTWIHVSLEEVNRS